MVLANARQQAQYALAAPYSPPNLFPSLREGAARAEARFNAVSPRRPRRSGFWVLPPEPESQPHRRNGGRRSTRAKRWQWCRNCQGQDAASAEEGLKRIIAATKKRWAAKRVAAAKPEPVVAKKPAVKKVAVKTEPAKAGKKVAAKVAVQKAAPRKTAPAKAAKAPVKKAAKKSASVTPQPTGAAGSVPAPEVAAQ